MLRRLKLFEDEIGKEAGRAKRKYVWTGVLEKFAKAGSWPDYLFGSFVRSDRFLERFGAREMFLTCRNVQLLAMR